jgi:hypothetical protein
VLGLGDSLGDSQPSAQLSASLDYTDNNVLIEHGGGDSIDADELTVIVSSGGTDYESDGTYGSRLSVGDQITANINDGDTTTGDDITSSSDVRIQVIHESSESILLDRTIETTDSLNGVTDSFPLS